MRIQFFLDMTLWPKNTVTHPRRMCMFSNAAVRILNLTYGFMLVTFLRYVTRFHGKTKLKSILHSNIHACW